LAALNRVFVCSEPTYLSLALILNVSVAGLKVISVIFLHIAA
jgi:hypothetical protein